MIREAAGVLSISDNVLDLVISTLENDLEFADELETGVRYYAFNGAVLH